jgi:hypothetical protein
MPWAKGNSRRSRNRDGAGDVIRTGDDAGAHRRPLHSIGGNNALLDFERAYQQTVQACLKRQLPLVVFTIYHANFPDPDYQKHEPA